MISIQGTYTSLNKSLQPYPEEFYVNILPWGRKRGKKDWKETGKGRAGGRKKVNADLEGIDKNHWWKKRKDRPKE